MSEMIGIVALINEFLLQSVDHKVRVFPCWPADKDAEFNELRRKIWSLAIRPEISSEFMNTAQGDTKLIKFEPNLCSSLCSATA